MGSGKDGIKNEKQYFNLMLNDVAQMKDKVYSKLKKAGTVLKESWGTSTDRNAFFKQYNKMLKQIKTTINAYYNFAKNGLCIVDTIELLNQLGQYSRQDYVTGSGVDVGVLKVDLGIIKYQTDSMEITINQLTAAKATVDTYFANLAKRLPNIDTIVLGKISRSHSSSVVVTGMKTAGENISCVATMLGKILANYNATQKEVGKAVGSIINGKPKVTVGDATYDFSGNQGTSNVSVLNKINLKTVPYSYKKTNYDSLAGFEQYKDDVYFDQYNSRYKGIFANNDLSYSKGCSAVTAALYWSIISGKKQDPKNYWKGTYSKGGAWWAGLVKETQALAKGQGYETTKGETSALQKSFDLLKDGKPSMIYITGSWYKTKEGVWQPRYQHYVTVIGIREGADRNNLTKDDFLVYDPYWGVGSNKESIKSLGDSMGTRYPIVTSTSYFQKNKK